MMTGESGKTATVPVAATPIRPGRALGGCFWTIAVSAFSFLFCFFCCCCRVSGPDGQCRAKAQAREANHQSVGRGEESLVVEVVVLDQEGVVVE